MNYYESIIPCEKGGVARVIFPETATEQDLEILTQVFSAMSNKHLAALAREREAADDNEIEKVLWRREKN